jgi:transcriptional regulator with GAF, ATPase, and Fis domain
MYDPLMVDTFMSVYHELPDESGAPASHTIEKDTAVGIRPPRSYNTVAAAHLSGYDHRSVTATSRDILSKGEAIATYVRRLIPSSLCVVFAYDSVSNTLEAVRAYGEASDAVRGVRVQLKQHLDEWLAANQTTIDSKVFLNLKTVNESSMPKSSCLSAPLFQDGHFIGVLVMYSSQSNAFDQDHIRVARGIAYEPMEATTSRRSS